MEENTAHIVGVGMIVSVGMAMGVVMVVVGVVAVVVVVGVAVAVAVRVAIRMIVRVTMSVIAVLLMLMTRAVIIGMGMRVALTMSILASLEFLILGLEGKLGRSLPHPRGRSVYAMRELAISHEIVGPKRDTYPLGLLSVDGGFVIIIVSVVNLNRIRHFQR